MPIYIQLSFIYVALFTISLLQLYVHNKNENNNHTICVLLQDFLSVMYTDKTNINTMLDRQKWSFIYLKYII